MCVVILAFVLNTNANHWTPTTTRKQLLIDKNVWKSNSATYNLQHSRSKHNKLEIWKFYTFSLQRAGLWVWLVELTWKQTNHVYFNFFLTKLIHLWEKMQTDTTWTKYIFPVGQLPISAHWCAILMLYVQACYLLFKVSSVLFIHQHQIKEVAYRELLVDIPHGGCQVISCKWRCDMPSHLS